MNNNFKIAFKLYKWAVDLYLIWFCAENNGIKETAELSSFQKVFRI